MQLGQRPRSQPGGTAGKILDHARRLFNEHGVMAVGIRQIARELGLSPGNVSYHFATREALVEALIEDLHARNTAQVATLPEQLDFTQADQLIRATMARDLENRWLMRDSVGLLTAMPGLRLSHEAMHRARLARVDAVVGRLAAAGLLDRRRLARGVERLRLQVVTQIFFWLPAAMVAAPGRDPAESLDAHASATLALLVPFCTAAGLKRLQPLLG